LPSEFGHWNKDDWAAGDEEEKGGSTTKMRRKRDDLRKLIVNEVNRQASPCPTYFTNENIGFGKPVTIKDYG